MGIVVSMKTILAILILAAAVSPVAALAAAPSREATKSAQATCTALRASMGATAFLQGFSSLGACVSKYAPVEQASITSANATCTAEQTAMGDTAFGQKYGTGKDGKNAFGNCVSSHAKASAQAERQGRLNPAQSCKALRTSLGAAVFSQTYGKNANDRNAFGKCVSAKARAQVSNEVSASDTCKAEQDADATAFASKYDSFGACVSRLARSESAAQQQATIKAAKACAIELKAGAAAFAAKYGTFGKCVSAKANA